jgi:hypothetical protein
MGLEDQKKACLERWEKSKPDRRKFALDRMAGKVRINPNWPEWFRRDIRAEEKQIRDEREREAREIEAARKRHAAKQTGDLFDEGNG